MLARSDARVAVACVLALAGCDRSTSTAVDASPPSAAVDAAPVRRTADAAAPADAGHAEDASAPADAGVRGVTAQARDAGASSCRIAYGPAELPFWGAAALVASASELRVVVNDGGKPRIHTVPITPPPPASAPVPTGAPSTSFEAMRGPPCDVAGKWVYCPGPGGVVSRTTLGASDTKPVAKARAGTRISAAALGEGHAVVATLDVRRTSEGETMQAFVTLDDKEPVRLSDDGAGATSVRLLARGGSAVAVYMDARAAMLPVHARTVSLRGDALGLASDAVVFIGGPPERGIDFTLAGGGKSLFALVPMPKESATFGMATIAIEDPPKDDVGASWSLYPNGLDPAPIAATTRASDTGATWVARVRPKEAAVGSPRVLELGKLDGAGAFTAVGTVAEGRTVAHVAIAQDAHGAIWVVYGDRSGSFLERLVCT